MYIQFYCEKLCLSQEEKLIYIEGILEKGVISPEMNVGIIINNHMDMCAPIRNVETINGDNTHLRLSIEYSDDDEKDIWIALNIGNEYIRIE